MNDFRTTQSRASQFWQNLGLAAVGSVVLLAPPVALQVASGATSAREVLAALNPARPWMLEATRAAFETLGQAGYLDAVVALEAPTPEQQADAMTAQLLPDVLSTQLSFVGDWRGALQHEAALLDTLGLNRANAEPQALEDLTPAPAVDAVLRAARGRQIVMLNEEHRAGVQRAFANRLLEGLRAEGFTHLALETLNDDARAQELGYPTLDCGTYTRDPVLGDLVRRAVGMGYTLVPYEASPEDITPRQGEGPLEVTNRRELIQAQNLLARTLEADPAARVVVFAGRGHIAETTGDQWVPMAAHVKTLSGVDPLTVDCTVLAERLRPDLEDPSFRALNERGMLGDEPAVLTAPDGGPWSALPAAYDMTVALPRTREVEGRPQWLAMGGVRQFVRVTLPVPESERPVLVQALVAGECDKAVPLDQVLVREGQQIPALALRPGEYRVRAVARAGRVVAETTTRVEALAAEAKGAGAEARDAGR